LGDNYVGNVAGTRMQTTTIRRRLSINFTARRERTSSAAVWTSLDTCSRSQTSSRPRIVDLHWTLCITVLTGNRMGWTVRCGRPPLLPSCRKLEFRLSVLMDLDLAWVNGKIGRQSWRCADAFQRSIISEAIYHFTHSHTHLVLSCICCRHWLAAGWDVQIRCDWGIIWQELSLIWYCPTWWIDEAHCSMPHLQTAAVYLT